MYLVSEFTFRISTNSFRSLVRQLKNIEETTCNVLDSTNSKTNSFRGNYSRKYGPHPNILCKINHKEQTDATYCK